MHVREMAPSIGKLTDDLGGHDHHYEWPEDDEDIPQIHPAALHGDFFHSPAFFEDDLGSGLPREHGSKERNVKDPVLVELDIVYSTEQWNEIIRY